MQCITTYMGICMNLKLIYVCNYAHACIPTYTMACISNIIILLCSFVINFQHSNLIADHNNISFEPTMTSITTVTCTQIVYKMMSFAFSLVISIIQK